MKQKIENNTIIDYKEDSKISQKKISLKIEKNKSKNEAFYHLSNFS